MAKFEFCNNDEDDGDGSYTSLSQLVNLSLDHAQFSSVLPGPFVVMQGSPGDGMSNTLDSMPRLPLPSLASSAAAARNGGTGSGGGNESRRNSATTSVQDFIPDGVLEDIDSDVSEESCERQRQQWEEEEGRGVTATAKDLKKTSKPESSRLPRRGNIGTEGGLHLPLGATSPLMQEAHHGTLLTNTLLSSGYKNHCHSPARKRNGDEMIQDSRAVVADAALGILDEKENNNHQSGKTPAELEAIHRWQQECQQKELAQLEESTQNVKLLMQRRKTREHQLQLERPTQHRGISSSRSASPVGTATSASSSSSDAALSPQPLSASALKEEEGGGEDPITAIIRALELAIDHRSWYQQGGRLVVFESLPHMSFGDVVAHPIITKTPTGMTLAPGCTVMAEAAYVLDSRTLKQRHSKPSSAPTTRPTLAFLKISSPHKGYVLSSIHSYPLMLPGLPVMYADNWLWRVTCQPDGAFVRKGLELETDHTRTLPFGTVCRVKRKVVNCMGLNRLEIEAHLTADGADVGGTTENASSLETFGMTGYVSQFLNPLSGQRGSVVEPIPFPVPILYRVVHAQGCVIRAGVELSTAQIGHAPPGTVLAIVGRTYSDHPVHRGIERLRLAGGGGWISVRLATRKAGEGMVLVETTGMDGRFDLDDPGGYHFASVGQVMEELRADAADSGCGGSAANRRAAHERSEGNASVSSSSPKTNGGTVAATESAGNAATTAVPTLFRSGVVPGLPTFASCPPTTDVTRDTSSYGHNPNPNRCLICLESERTATIVHGETGHVVCCLACARILKARGDSCPVCRLPIDLVIQQFWA